MAYRNATIIEDLGLRDDALQESIYLSSIAMFANLTYEGELHWIGQIDND